MNRLKRVHFAAVGRDIHIDVPLSNVAMDYRPQGMIADMLAPVVPVPNLSGIIPQFGPDDTFRIADDTRAPGTAANEVTREVGSDSFYCKNHALSHGVALEDKFNADPIYVQKLFNGAAEYLTGKLSLGWENRLALKCTSGSNVGSYSAVSSSWSDLDNSDPLGDVNTAIDNVQDSRGYRPNKVTFSNNAWRYFRRNANVRNLIYGTNNGGGYVSRQQAAELLEVDEVLVAAAYKNTKAEGQSMELDQVWENGGANVLVHYAPSSPSTFEPSFMYSFRWSQPGVPNMQAERHPYDSVKKRELVEVGYYQDEHITDAKLAFLLTAVDSST